MQSSKTTLNLSSSLNNLIIGHGEVGKALESILSKFYTVGTADVKGGDMHENLVYDGEIFERTDILHICFPYYDKSFVSDVLKYQRIHEPKFTIIHSTVPVGTCKKLRAIHSPIRGIHPQLEEGILTFPKFLGGKNASLVADVFRRAGMKVILVDNPETTEAGKLFDTEYYRVCIEFTKTVKAYCDKHKLNFHEVYTLFNQTYNEGYTKLGFPELARPILQPIMTPIGGHCVSQNKELLNEKV